MAFMEKEPLFIRLVEYSAPKTMVSWTIIKVQLFDIRSITPMRLIVNNRKAYFDITQNGCNFGWEKQVHPYYEYKTKQIFQTRKAKKQRSGHCWKRAHSYARHLWRYPCRFHDRLSCRFLPNGITRHNVSRPKQVTSNIRRHKKSTMLLTKCAHSFRKFSRSMRKRKYSRNRKNCGKLSISKSKGS